MGEFTVNLDTVVFLVLVVEVRGELVTLVVVGKEQGLERDMHQVSCDGPSSAPVILGQTSFFVCLKSRL